MRATLLSVYISAACSDLDKYDALRDQMKRAARGVKNCVNEAQSPESRADFIHKLKIADKELCELTGMVATEGSKVPLIRIHSALLLELCLDVARLLGKSISSAKRNRNTRDKI
ncbi:MAG: four helix bundle protein [Ignavibacteria bacterium]|nr:four helix bundle protein [Ignavibacteria bacterium]